MEIEPQNVLIYARSDGSAPFTEWFDDMKDMKARASIRSRLDRLEVGSFGDAKTVGEGVSELRIDVGPGYRVYYGRHGKRIVILLCGGDKSSQAKDISKAKKFWADYRRRSNA
jgi:putative addiction module killer protein